MTTDALKESVLAEVLGALAAFNSRRWELIEEAYKTGGVHSVDNLLNEYEAIRDARWELIQRELDKKNSQYSALLGDAQDAASGITKSIKNLEAFGNTMAKMTHLVSTIGRILVVLGL